MGQLSFFELNRRYESLTEKNDPLAAIAAMVPFESFRPSVLDNLARGDKFRHGVGVAINQYAAACRISRV